MSNLQELTVIIPSFNRQDYIRRQMRFWSMTPVQVHILDGTPSAISTSEDCALAPNIHYHHLPISVYERLAISAQLIETKYAVLLGDDEFYIPSALSSCIKQIRELDLVACGGLAVAFCHRDGAVLGRKRFYEMRGRYLDSPDPAKRMIQSVTPVLPSVIYAVHRSDVFKDNMSMFKRFKSSCAATSEIQFTLMTCLRGKTKILDELLWLRSCENTSVRTEKWRSAYPIYEWYHDPNNRAEVESFYKVMLDLAAQLTDVNVPGLREVLEGAVNQVVDFKSARKRKQASANVIVECSRITSRILPDFIKAIFKPIFGKTLKALGSDEIHESFVPIQEVALQLSRDGVAVDFDQVAAIERMIISFHAGRKDTGAIPAEELVPIAAGVGA